jgi:hypothetical protein
VITDVGIDMDGVMYDFAGVFKSYCENRLQVNAPLPEPKHWEFYEDWGLSKETFYEWLTDATVSEKVFLTGNPYPNCVAGWQKLRSLNLNIHVLTHRHIEAVGQTSEWLQFHGFIPDSIHFTTHKGVLEAIAAAPATTTPPVVAPPAPIVAPAAPAPVAAQPTPAAMAPQLASTGANEALLGFGLFFAVAFTVSGVVIVSLRNRGRPTPTA